VSLVGYVLSGLRRVAPDLDPSLGRALAIPVVAALVWLGVRRIRRMVMKSDDKAGAS
jgi:uncharacterized membrane-anchored protein